jgi:HSP20 family protein
MFALKPFTKRTPNLLPRVETPLTWLPEDFGNLFNRFFNWPVMETPEWPFRWALTTEELEKEYLIRVELPGFAPEEVKVEMTGEELTVEAEHKAPVETKAEKPAENAERTYAHVKRVLTLPPDVEREKAEAIYRHGVLELHLPRKPEAMGRRLEVKT